jgi:glycine reductase complex component B subunit alpha and beta
VRQGGAMKLQLESIDIKDVKIGSETRVIDHILYLNTENLEKEILADKRIKSVCIDVAFPGERVRIVNLNDVIQPRCKIDADNADFPGWVGRLTVAGQGRTRSLRGVSVVVSNPCTKRKYSAILDMSGVATGSYGYMRNICIAPEAFEGVEDRDFESAVKTAGLKTAVYLAQSAKEHPVDEIEVFDLDISRFENVPGLPRIGYYFQIYTSQRDFYKGGADPIFYGTEISGQLPIVVHPNEVLDGGITNMHTIYPMDTFSIQNHALIKELYKRHRKELIFSGVVIGVANIDPVQSQRKAMMAANLFSNILGSDGALLNTIMGGLVQVDLSLVAHTCEKYGVKTTVLVHTVHSGGYFSEQLTYMPKSLNAAVNTAQAMERIRIPLDVEKVLGGTKETPIFHPDGIPQKAGDKIIEVEVCLIAGILDLLGGSKIKAFEY